MPLLNTLVLILDQNGDGFAEELLNALVSAEAEAMVATTVVEALDYLERFEFSAVLFGDPPHFDKYFIDAIGGVPIIFYGQVPNVIHQPQECVRVQRNANAILRELNSILGAP